MSRVFLIIAAAMCAASMSAQTDAEVAIRSGGARIVERTPGANTACNSSLYSPHVLFDSQPVVFGRDAVMYAQGGEFTDPCQYPVTFRGRFGDAIWYHYQRKSGTWSTATSDPKASGAPIIDRSSFPWMNEPSYITFHPEATVGHLASPSVVKVGKRYFMVFTATIDDRNLCAAEHLARTNCGRCDDPWSYFVVMWATSNDGQRWTVWPGRATQPRSNRALNASLLWAMPHRYDMKRTSHFKGFARASMVHVEEGDSSYFYIATSFWGTYKQKGVMFRLKFDPESPLGFSTDAEAWDDSKNKWFRCFDGEAPAWINDTYGRGDVFEGLVANMSKTSWFPGYKYIATTSGNSLTRLDTANAGNSNIIQYQLSNDFVNWTRPKIVNSLLPFFADGRGYDGSVIDPQYVEDEGGAYHLYFAAADGTSQADVLRDGRHDCNPVTSETAPTAVFLGTGIYEGTGGSASASVRQEPED